MAGKCFLILCLGMVEGCEDYVEMIRIGWYGFSSRIGEMKGEKETGI